MEGRGAKAATRLHRTTQQPAHKPSGVAVAQARVLTLDEEEEAHDPHGRHDGPGHDEGQAPARGHPVASNQGPQDVAHGGVGVPDPHDQTSPATQTQGST